MTKTKKMILIIAVIALLGTVSVGAYAATYDTPAEAAAGVTGKTVDQVVAERLETGKTYGTIADEAGKLDAFKDAMIQMKQEILDERVTDGAITQERADDIMAAIEERAAACDGTGPADGTRLGAGFGFGRNGSGAGKGAGRGMGYGMGRGQGACLYQ
jgi:hypothetical protein